MNKYIKAFLSGKSVTQVELDRLIAAFKNEWDDDKKKELSTKMFNMAFLNCTGLRSGLSQEQKAAYVTTLQQAMGEAILDDVKKQEMAVHVRKFIAVNLYNMTSNRAILESLDEKSRGRYVSAGFDALSGAAQSEQEYRHKKWMSQKAAGLVIDPDVAFVVLMKDMRALAEKAVKFYADELHNTQDRRWKERAVKTIAALTTNGMIVSVMYAQDIAPYVRNNVDILKQAYQNESHPDVRAECVSGLCDIAWDMLLLDEMPAEDRSWHVEDICDFMIDALEHEQDADVKFDVVTNLALVLDDKTIADALSPSEHKYVMQKTADALNNAIAQEENKDARSAYLIAVAKLAENNPAMAEFLNEEHLQELGLLDVNGKRGDELEFGLVVMNVFLLNKDDAVRAAYAEKLGVYAAQLNDEFMVNITDIDSVMQQKKNPLMKDYRKLRDMQQALTTK